MTSENPPTADSDRFGPSLPWSRKKLAKLGKSMAAETPIPAGCPSADEVLTWYLELGLVVHESIAGLDWESLLGQRAPAITWRVKTIDTLREKLRRDPQFPLVNIFDIAGVRFEAEMTLDEQDAVVDAVEAFFRDRGVTTVRKDYREGGGHSGYRAVHLLLNLAGRVEVQVRTEIQGHWANVYEVLADRVGREIRYDQLPAPTEDRDLVLGVQELSTGPLREMENDLRKSAIISFDAELNANRGALSSPVTAQEVERRRAEWGEAKALLRDLEATIRGLDD